MNILITGISGFVGRHVVEHFAGFPDFVLFGTSRKPEEAKAVFGDKVKEIVTGADADARYLNVRQIEGVIHLAGIAHDLKGAFNDSDYFQVNYENTRRLYDEFVKSNASRFVFVSSIKAAVDVTIHAVDETIAPNPVTPYGQSKLKAEQHILEHSLNSAKQHYILRPCMVYGPGNKGNLNLLYQLVKRGIPYPFGSFHNRRSFLYIENFTFILEKLFRSLIPSGVYHLSDGESLSTRELVTLMGESIGKPARVINCPVSWAKAAAWLGDATGAFFNSHTLQKLTENMETSHSKIISELGEELPYDVRTGLRKTLSTFS